MKKTYELFLADGLGVVAATPGNLDDFQRACCFVYGVDELDKKDPSCFFTLCRDYQTGRHLIIARSYFTTDVVMEDEPPYVQVLYRRGSAGLWTGPSTSPNGGGGATFWERKDCHSRECPTWMRGLGSFLLYNKHFLEDFPAKLVDVQEVEEVWDA